MYFLTLFFFLPFFALKEYNGLKFYHFYARILKTFINFALKKKCMENLGIIISILVGLATLLSMVIWFGRFIQRVNVHDKKLDEMSSDVNEVKKIVPMVSLHDKKLDEMSSDVNEVKKIVPLVALHDKKLDELSNDMSQVKDGLTTIKALLLMKFKDLEPALAAKHSPRTLNELGKKIFDDMNGQSFLEKNKQLLYAVIDKDKPKTAYDVENLCYYACAANVNNDAFNEIKSFLYNYPTLPLPDGRQYEVTMDAACSVLSLPLRDMYLADHPDIIK